MGKKWQGLNANQDDLVLPKPDSCRGCPAYGDGRGFVPDTIRPRAPIVVYAQGPGESEERGQRYLGSDQWEARPPAPLIGKTGRILNQTFLSLAGLNREDCHLANSVRCRWTWDGKKSNKLPPIYKKELQQAIEHCTKAHAKPFPGAKVYVAMGEYAFYTLTGLLHDFSGWRGYLLPKRHPWEPRIPLSGIWTPGASDDKVFVTHHLAYLWKEPEAELPAKRDWNKLASILDGTWPVAPPPFHYEPPDLWPSYAAFDTEFEPEHPDRLVRYSLATRDRRVWVVEADRAVQTAVLPSTTVIMHNAPADLPHLRGLINLTDIEIEDTMYAHAVLWTGKVETDEDKGKGGGAMSHKLNFLGSLYAKMNRWKHLSKMAPKLYAGGDALGTMEVWETGLHGGLKGELERDPQSKWVYENLQKPLVPIVVRNRQRGIASNPEKVALALKDIKAEQAQATLRAQAYAGWLINLRSPKQLAYWLYDQEGLRVKRRARA